jgi:GGDEF domain-containing protein
LRAAVASQELEGEVQAWIEDGRQASVEKVADGAGHFSAHPVAQTYDFSGNNTVWVKLPLARSPQDPTEWVLDVPVPFLDSLSLFQRNAAGQWTEQQSGDRLAHRDWTRQTLVPSFRLVWNGNATQEAYLRIRNYSPAYVPIRISAESRFESRQAAELMVMGWVAGLLITLSLVSLLRYYEHRYRGDLGAMVYGFLATLTILQINGVLNMSLWQDLPVVANYGSKLIATIGVGGSLLYLRQLYALSIHYHRFDKLLGGTGLAAIGLALVLLVLDPASANVLESSVFVFATVIGLTAAVLTWRAGSPIWQWMMLATVPQALCVLWLSAETVGLVLPHWETRYVTSFCVALSVPVLSYALRKVTRDRKDRALRAQQLDKQDALTGLLKRDVFDVHLNQALQRVRESQEAVALVVVSLVNHGQIVSKYGGTIGEQCELRAVVKLHRVLRDVDPASRIGMGRFALLLEGVQSRDVLNARMVKLIASGLTPLPGLYPEVPLHFHAACVLLQQQPIDALNAIDELTALLETIAPGSRRPIRYIEAAATMPYPPTADA